MTWRRLKACVELWPDCVDGVYNPACCRFPKSCSCMADDEDPFYSEQDFEPDDYIAKHLRRPPDA